MAIKCIDSDQAFNSFLIGTGASGKSTFLKQLKVLHKEGFSATEVEQFKETLPLNTMQSMQKLLQVIMSSPDCKVSSKTKVRLLRCHHMTRPFLPRRAKWRAL